VTTSLPHLYKVEQPPPWQTGYPGVSNRATIELAGRSGVFAHSVPDELLLAMLVTRTHTTFFFF
jgi:hypothetical protein